MGEFGRAVHRAARWLEIALPSGLAPRSVVAVLSTASPIVFHAVVVALMRLDLVPALISPILTVPTATQSLLAAMDCTTVLVSGRVPIIAASLKALEAAQYRVATVEMPSVAELYPRLGREHASDPFEPLAPSAPVSEADIDTRPAIMFHTTGSSTGSPKPVTHSWRSTFVYCSGNAFGDLDMCGLVLGAMAVPPSHVLNTFASLGFAFQAGGATALFDPSSPPVAPPEMPAAILKVASVCDWILGPPVMWERFCSVPPALERLAHLKAIIYAGGPLSDRAFDVYEGRGIPVKTFFGATERASERCFGPADLRSLPAQRDVSRHGRALLLDGHLADRAHDLRSRRRRPLRDGRPEQRRLLARDPDGRRVPHERSLRQACDQGPLALRRPRGRPHCALASSRLG